MTWQHQTLQVVSLVALEWDDPSVLALPDELLEEVAALKAVQQHLAMAHAPHDVCRVVARDWNKQPDVPQS